MAISPVLDLKEDILRLKKERNAVILAHNYQIGAIQDIADYVGDSLGLAYRAQETDADVIVFCGVHFMAETAKILNPNKTVVLPDKDAGCSLEQACPTDKLEAYLEEQKDKNYYVIAYINCSAGVKALCDVICTSGNAPKIVNQAPKIAQSCLFPTPTLANGLSSRQVARWISGKAPATFTSNSPGSRSRKSKMNILTPKLSLIRNAPKRSDFLLMKYAPPKKWCIFAGNRPRKTSSSSLNQECFIAFKKRFQRRTSSLAPPTIAPALIAAT